LTPVTLRRVRIAALIAAAACVTGFSTPSARAQDLTPAVSNLLSVTLNDVPKILLSPFDNQQALTDDEFDRTDRKLLPVGRERLVSFDESLGRWYDAPGGGAIWVADFVSPNALAVRIQLTGMNLPEGAAVTVYNPSDATQAHGQFEGQGPIGSGEHYVPRVFGDTARVEAYFPAGRPAVLPVRVERLLHIYRPWQEDPNLVSAQAAGTCHNDVSCYSAWEAVARAVGLIDYVSAGVGYTCTGQLVRTVANDQTPYFVTATHCLDTQTEAQTATIYWSYQKTTCGGAVPALGSSSFSSVCDYLFSNATNDVCMLMVRGTLPANRFWVAWRTNASAALTNGLGITGIHHPSGDYKRITFGTYSTSTPPCSATQHVRANWTSGVTEGGSSGSGIYRNDTQELIGVLTCGPSFCGASTASLTDSYGNFATAYTNATLSGLLAAGSDDVYEPNNSCAAANTTLLAAASGNVANLVCKSTGEDWYRVTLQPGASISSTITINRNYGNMQLQVFGTCAGTALVTANNTASNTQTVSYTNPNPVATNYFVRASMVGSSTRNTYSISWTITTPVLPSNDNCASATTITPGSYSFNTTNATTDGPTDTLCNYAGSSQIFKDVWFKYTPTQAGSVVVGTCTSAAPSFDSKLAVYQGCPSGVNTAIACQDDNCGASATFATVTFNAAANTTYLVRVGGFNSAAGLGTLVLGFTPAPPPVTCPADIAFDDGTPLNQPTIASNTGVNEGDYNCFFAANGFFNQSAIGPAAIGDFCDIAFDDGTPLNQPTIASNNGVNEGDYNCFFNSFFVPCL